VVSSPASFHVAIKRIVMEYLSIVDMKGGSRLGTTPLQQWINGIGDFQPIKYPAHLQL